MVIGRAVDMNKVRQTMLIGVGISMWWPYILCVYTCVYYISVHIVYHSHNQVCSFLYTTYFSRILKKLILGMDFLYMLAIVVIYFIL